MRANGSEISPYPQIMPVDAFEEAAHFDKSRVRLVDILDSLEASDMETGCILWDVSAEQDGSVTALLLDGGTKLVVAGNGSGKIVIGPSMRKMFAGFISLERIDGLNVLNTSKVTDMSYLFQHCVSLRELDLSGWDVSRVENFRGTFCCGHNQVGDARLEKLSLTGWDVSSATNMAYMFYGCGRLEHVDVSGWNTSHVTNFRHTFADCFALHEIDVSRWDTGSVVTLDGIFNDCRSLKRVDISGWNTSACQEFDQIFDGCNSLQMIDGIEKLNTSNGISFEEMLFGCKSLESLDLSSLDTRKVDGREFTAYQSSIRASSNMKKMLVGCNGLTNLVLGRNLVFFQQGETGSVIREKLDANGYVLLSPETGSMTPLLRPKRDHAVFRKKDQYRVGDIVLYRSVSNNKLIMHRVARPLADGFLVRGDHSRYAEYVPAENVFAAVDEIHKGDKSVKAGTPAFKVLSLWSVEYNRFRYAYKRSDGLFWKAARKARRTMHSRKGSSQ